MLGFGRDRERLKESESFWSEHCKRNEQMLDRAIRDGQGYVDRICELSTENAHLRAALNTALGHLTAHGDPIAQTLQGHVASLKRPIA